MQRNNNEDICLKCPPVCPQLWRHQCTVCNVNLCDDCRENCPDCGDLVCSEHSWFCDLCERTSCYNCEKPYLVACYSGDEKYCEHCLCIRENEADIGEDRIRVVDDKGYVTHEQAVPVQ